MTSPIENAAASLSKYITTNYTTPYAYGGVLIAGGAAIEMALRVFDDLAKLGDQKTRSKALNNLSADLGGAIFYGLCAANIISGTAFVGAAIFTTYSVFFCKNDEDSYLTSKLLGRSIKFVFNEIIYPIIKKVAEIADAILTPIFRVVTDILSHIKLPEKPVWYGVALLVTAIVSYKVALPLLFKAAV